MTNKILFHFDWTPHWLEEDNAERDADEIMRDVTNRNVTFNDLAQYWGLLAEEGCTRVELIGVRCEHSRFVMGVQSVYRSFFRDGTTGDSSADPHFFRMGYYAHAGGHSQISSLELDVERGEHIVDVRTRRGEIVDRVTFVTNLREVSFGGMGGSSEEVRAPNLMRRVVALAGTENGVLHRLGYYSTSMNWKILKPVIILRNLIEQERALQLTDQFTNEDLVLGALVTEADDDIFKHVLSFLRCN